MLQNNFSKRYFRLTKWSSLVHSNMRNAPYIHPSHDSIFELWRTFPNAKHFGLKLYLPRFADESNVIIISQLLLSKSDTSVVFNVPHSFLNKPFRLWY